jgi:hypothetical protein
MERREQSGQPVDPGIGELKEAYDQGFEDGRREAIEERQQEPAPPNDPAAAGDEEALGEATAEEGVGGGTYTPPDP